MRGGRRLGRLLYQVLSAPAHAHQWAAYLGVHWERLDELDLRLGSWTTRVQGDQHVAALVTSIAVLGYEGALTDLERYIADVPDIPEDRP